MRPAPPGAHAGGMSLIYLPLIVAFAAFVIYGGIVMPVMEIAESIRARRS